MTMNQRIAVTILAVVATTTTGLVMATLPPVASVTVTPDLAMLPPDGGQLIYVGWANDGGMVRVQTPGCVRRGVGGSTTLCRKKTAASPTLGEVTGELNRFSASLALPVVNTCLPVACGVVQGENANLAEVDIVNQMAGVVVP